MINKAVAVVKEPRELTQVDDFEESDLLNYGGFCALKNGKLEEVNYDSKLTEIRARQVEILPDNLMRFSEVITRSREPKTSPIELYIKDAQTRAMNSLTKKLVMSQPSPQKKITWGDIVYKVKYELRENYLDSMKEAIQNLPRAMDKANKRLGKTILGPLNSKNNLSILSSFTGWTNELSRTVFPEIENDSFMPSSLDEIIYNFKEVKKAYARFNFELLKRETGEDKDESWVRGDFEKTLFGEEEKREIPERIYGKIFSLERNNRIQKEKDILFNHNSPYYLLKEKIIPFFERLKTTEIMKCDISLIAEYGRSGKDMKLDKNFFERYNLAPDTAFIKQDVLPFMKGKNSKKRFEIYKERLGKDFLGELYPVTSPEQNRLAKRYLGLTEQLELVERKLDRVFKKLIFDNVSGLKNKASFRLDIGKPLNEIRGKYSKVLEGVYILYQEGKNPRQEYSFNSFYNKFKDTTKELNGLKNRLRGTTPADEIYSELVGKTSETYSDIRNLIIKSFGLPLYGLRSSNGTKSLPVVNKYLKGLEGDVKSLESQLYGVAV